MHTTQWSWGLDPHHDTETGVPPERANPTNIRVGRDQMGAERDIQQVRVVMVMVVVLLLQTVYLRG